MGMEVQALATAALLLAQLSLAPVQAEALWGRAVSPVRQLGARGPAKDHRRAGDGGDNHADGSYPLAAAWGAPAEPPSSFGAPSKAMGSSKQGPRRTPRSRSPWLNHHLRGHGKFNTDTHSCGGIQRRPCQKPSDCGGCLGLYTCRLPTGTCGLKAVSRQRGGFLHSILSAQGHAGLEQRSWA